MGAWWSSGEEETIDRLTSGWRLYQLKNGHRFSNDDIFTAFRAAAAAPAALTLLDLGSGVGSVGLATLWRLPADASLVMIEAQEVSHRLARKTIRLNKLENRVQPYLMDLRQLTTDSGKAAIPRSSGGFDLITGSPPYLPLGASVLSKHSQKAHCRVELRGGVYDYCAAAVELLAPGGRFVFVMAAQDERTEDAPVKHGMVIVERYDIVFKEGRAPHICVCTCAREEDVSTPISRIQKVMVLRDANGRRTPAYRAFQEFMQLPANRASLEELEECITQLQDHVDRATVTQSVTTAFREEAQNLLEQAAALGLEPGRGSECQLLQERLKQLPISDASERGPSDS